ncbi:hypothetical protein ACFWIJ_44840 [Streptomyces sp. NPDC127079]|uniref:hypothetical protein n=1 Tax=Streptomyces sp. NPDC127079 TaxID=3347132 RepID=UPI003663780E
MRTSFGALTAVGVVTAAQLCLAAGASARTEAPQSTGCPVDIVYPSRFYANSGHWVTNGGLYFAVKNRSATKNFTKVTFTVTEVKNIRFGTAAPTGGRVTRRTPTTVSVSTTTLKKRTSLGVRVRSHLLDTHAYEVKFALHGTGWTCAVDQGTWGS